MTGLKHRHSNEFAWRHVPYKTTILVPVRTPHAVIRSWAARYERKVRMDEMDLIPKHLQALDKIRRQYPYTYFVPVDREARGRKVLEEAGYEPPEVWVDEGRYRDYTEEPAPLREGHLDLMVWFTKYPWWMQHYPELYGYGSPGFSGWPLV